MAQARIPSLDGLRALSIAFVLVQHTVRSTGDPFVKYTTHFGTLGVMIFFVISGFIITNLLLREAERGPISLLQFYLRRGLRLLPALFAYLVFVAIIQEFVVDLKVRPIYFFSGAFFLVPYIPWGHHPWATGHLWSLAVEEHFYMLWPPLLAWLGVKRAKWLLIVAVVIMPVLRVCWYKADQDPLLNSLVGIGDLMAFGALAAIWSHRQPEQMLRYMRRSVTLGRIVAVVAIGIILYLRTTRILPIVDVPFGITVIGLAVAYLLLSVCFAEQTSLLFRLLNWPAVAWVGTISYSLYLWQQPFLYDYAPQNQWWQQFPVNIVFAVVAGIASHYLVERPFLKLKSRMKPYNNAQTLSLPLPVGSSDVRIPH